MLKICPTLLLSSIAFLLPFSISSCGNKVPHDALPLSVFDISDDGVINGFKQFSDEEINELTNQYRVLYIYHKTGDTYIKKIADNAFAQPVGGKTILLNINKLQFDPRLQLETIGDYAFKNCNMFNGGITIPRTVNYIGKEAFYNCAGFNTNLTLYEVLEIGDNAFDGCANFNVLKIYDWQKTPTWTGSEIFSNWSNNGEISRRILAYNCVDSNAHKVNLFLQTLGFPTNWIEG